MIIASTDEERLITKYVRESVGKVVNKKDFLHEIDRMYNSKSGVEYGETHGVKLMKIDCSTGYFSGVDVCYEDVSDDEIKIISADYIDRILNMYF